MKFRYSLLLATALSVGFIQGTDAASPFKKMSGEKSDTTDPNFAQYKSLTEVKKAVSRAMNIHNAMYGLPQHKKNVENDLKEIATFDEIQNRLDANELCNVSILNNYFSSGKKVWDNMITLAEDYSTNILAEAENYMSAEDGSGNASDAKTAENNKKLLALEGQVAGAKTASQMNKISATAKVNANKMSVSAEDTEAANQQVAFDDMSGINKNGELKDVKSAMEKSVKSTDKDTKKYTEQANSATSGTTDVDNEASQAFGKLRWDVGYFMLRDLYAHQKDWGATNKRFQPWIDQKRVYDAYLKDKYAELRKAYNIGVGIGKRVLPADAVEPHLSDSDSYLPEDYTNEAVKTLNDKADFESGKTADERWCGVGNECQRVTKGSLYTQHQAYMAALIGAKTYTSPIAQNEGSSFMSGVMSAIIPAANAATSGSANSGLNVSAALQKAPYLPSAPLPPWKESVFINGVDKELPVIRSQIPEPWSKIIMYLKNGYDVAFSNKGELANLVEKHKDTIRFRPKDYDSSTYEVKEDKHGNPVLPLPLRANRISANLALRSALMEQRPIMENAKQAIIDENADLVKDLAEQIEYVAKKDFTLEKDADYAKMRKDLESLHGQAIKEAQALISKLESSKGILSEVKDNLIKEKKALQALGVDKGFKVSIDRENADEVVTLVNKAIADETGVEVYKDYIEDKSEEASVVPDMGCPIN